MNPDAPPDNAIQQAPRNVYPCAAKSGADSVVPFGWGLYFLFVMMSIQHLNTGFKFRRVDFLNAGAGILLGLIGISAFFLAALRLSQKARQLTICWSAVAVGFVLVSLFFEPPNSQPDIVAVATTLLALLAIGVLAFRSKPTDEHQQPHMDA